jgi:hypothetical protein
MNTILEGGWCAGNCQRLQGKREAENGILSRIVSTTFTDGFILQRIGRCPRGECTYRKKMGGNVHWGVAAQEDKVVQQAVVTILNQIYEEDFLGFSYGFRPGVASMMRWIEFGRFAEENRKRRGEGKPETFDFLGFTHISGKNARGRILLPWLSAGFRN